MRQGLTVPDLDRPMSGSEGAPVYIAAQFGNVQVLRLLLEAQANVYTALPPKAVRILCQHGADRNRARTDNGTTPLYRAVQMHHSEGVGMLIKP